METLELIFIETPKNTDSLQAMMLLDIGFYSFQKSEKGILIELDADNPKSLNAFINRFSLWLARESFLTIGDEYFKNHKYEEKWNIWKNDFRFLNAYCDEFYKAYVLHDWKTFLYDLDHEGLYALEVSLKDLINEVREITEIRMKLIEEHFENSIHKEYILLCLDLYDLKRKKSSTSM